MLIPLGIGGHGDRSSKHFGSQKPCYSGQWPLTSHYFKCWNKEDDQNFGWWWRIQHFRKRKIHMADHRTSNVIYVCIMSHKSSSKGVVKVVKTWNKCAQTTVWTMLLKLTPLNYCLLMEWKGIGFTKKLQSNLT